MKGRRPIESLDSKHMMSIILYIYENGPCRRIDIHQNISKNANISQKIGELIDMEVLSEELTFRGAVLSLTQTGIAVAEHLRSIEALVC